MADRGCFQILCEGESVFPHGPRFSPISFLHNQLRPIILRLHDCAKAHSHPHSCPAFVLLRRPLLITIIAPPFAHHNGLHARPFGPSWPVAARGGRDTQLPRLRVLRRPVDRHVSPTHLSSHLKLGARVRFFSLRRTLSVRILSGVTSGVTSMSGVT